MPMRRGLVGIGDPPEVQPIGIDLMIRHHYCPLPEVYLQQPAFGALVQSASYALVPGDAHDGRTPPLRHRRHEQAEILFRERHPRVVVVVGEEVEGRAEQLGEVDEEAGAEEVDAEA